ncbi:alpha-galactosidase [Bifidobacterium psychraerophilum]|uniref:alpha-galactosidase n=1 Tax=Bifidobacterium psychraerophilum TaxID=218140 RepID=UPI003341B469
MWQTAAPIIAKCFAISFLDGVEAVADRSQIKEDWVMPVIVHEESQEFHLQTKNTSYLFRVMEDGTLGQLYYGARIPDKVSHQSLSKYEFRMIQPWLSETHKDFSLNTLKQEYPGFGHGDFRMPAFQIAYPDGSRITEFVYEGYGIEQGKQRTTPMPASYGTTGECDVLTIRLAEQQSGLRLLLEYSVFPADDVIVRSAHFANTGHDTLNIENALSMSIDLPDSEYEMLQMSGSWARERHLFTRRLKPGIQSISSTRGASSAQHNPFLALLRPGTTEDTGDVYGFSLVYSGSFIAQVEVDDYDVARVGMGINPFEFSWTLDPGERFDTPESILTFSESGLGGMSANLHHFLSEHLINPAWRGTERPILINNWEATYFNFDEKKLVTLARQAKQLGIEMLVLDDGWFGHRNDSTTSVGDWHVDTSKLPEGLGHLAQEIHSEGMKFGLWFEPEMVSEESELFKAHPDWAIAVPGRRRSPSRSQFVLDMSRQEIVDYLFDRIADAIDQTNLDYIKWDMNRHITESFSNALPPERQLELGHRYIMGVYQLYDRLTKQYPHVLFESCSSGGGRFDPGMLAYAPQAWTSDDTDAVERLKIQWGTSLAYPLCTMGSHVSAVPNHQVNRITPLKTRGDTAFFGLLGYELDITKLDEEERAAISDQVAFYKSHRALFQYGDFIRLTSPYEGDGNITSWGVVDPQRDMGIFALYQVLAKPNDRYHRFIFKGLDPNKSYTVNESDEHFAGSELMHAGIVLDQLFGVRKQLDRTFDFTSRMFIVESVER